MNNDKRYHVYNATDGVLASPGAMTYDEASAFVRHFPDRYARQGYYLTAHRQRIPPSDVQLTIIEA